MVRRRGNMEIGMKLLLSFGAFVVFMAVSSLTAEQMWSGQISDSRCGASHATAMHGKKMTDRACVDACAQKGAQYVLVSDGKVYKLMNHDLDLKAHAGHTVNVTGELKGETIRVLKIEMGPASPRH
jgi:hypothetical protein